MSPCSTCVLSLACLCWPFLLACPVRRAVYGYSRSMPTAVREEDVYLATMFRMAPEHFEACPKMQNRNRCYVASRQCSNCGTVLKRLKTCRPARTVS
jgi:hypothetical protein